MTKTVIFGGAFDPVHKGHMMHARNVLNFFKFDRLVFMPSKTPPHKAAHSASGEDRLNMLRIAANTLGTQFSVSDMELKHSGTSYTFATIEGWKAENPSDDVYFSVGSDIFATIECWHNWRRLLKLARFIVVKRAGYDFTKMFKSIAIDISKLVVKADEFIKGRDGRVILFKTEELEVSSTYIRGKILKDTSLVSPEVLGYITKHDLYKGQK